MLRFTPARTPAPPPSRSRGGRIRPVPIGRRAVVSITSSPKAARSIFELSQRLGGVAQRAAGSRGRVLARIGVAEELGLELELALDAGDAGGDQRGIGEIGVEIGAADAALDANRLGALAAQAVAGGAVVGRPDRLGRREGAGDEALVAVDVGREEIGDLARVREQARDLVPASVADMPCGSPVVGEGAACRRGSTATGGCARTSRRRLWSHLARKVIGVALRPGDLLAAVLDDGVAVGRGQRVGIADVDLLLAGAASPLEFSTGMPAR